jgi:hypothetical protein
MTILSTDDGREETAAQRFDRNTIELLNELRVAGTGIQVMFGFLLIVPFNTGWKRLSSFGRTEYFLTLIYVAIAAVLLLAPSIQHRILFRHGEKRYPVSMANRLAITAMVLLAAGFTGTLILIADVVVGGLSPVAVGVPAAVGIFVVWFGVPIVRLAAEDRDQPGPAAGGENAPVVRDAPRAG